MSNVAECLKAFEEIATTPGKQLGKLISDGKKVVGCIPEYTPEELVFAAGMVPFGVWGAEMEISEAKKYFAPFYCSIVQTTLEMGLRGQLNSLSAVLIPILCDTLKCLGQNWKVGVPQVPFIQVSHPQNVLIPAGTVYLTKVYKRIAKKLEEISGEAITEEKLKEAIKVYNEHRVAMREFARVVGQHPELVSPYQRNCVFKSSYFITKPEHTKMVRGLIAELSALPKIEWKGRKVVITGIMADSPALLKILEDNKIAVVADELAHESRQFLTDVPNAADPFEALAKQFTSIRGCSLVLDPEKKRGSNLAEMAKANGAEGVIYLQTKFCDPEEFDYPIVKKDLEKAGIPIVNVEIDQQMRTYEQARTAIQTFATVLA
jgi:bcr-type benzoyl-CoA reductase subunit C